MSRHQKVALTVFDQITDLLAQPARTMHELCSSARLTGSHDEASAMPRDTMDFFRPKYEALSLSI